MHDSLGLAHVLQQQLTERPFILSRGQNCFGCLLGGKNASGKRTGGSVALLKLHDLVRREDEKWVHHEMDAIEHRPKHAEAVRLAHPSLLDD